MTIAGKAGVTGSADGTNSVARFAYPDRLAVASRGNLYLSETDNNTIRMGVPLPVFESVTPAGDHTEIVVNAAPGQTVQLQYSSDLASATWTNLGNPITAVNGAISAFDTPEPNQPRFYRAIVVSPRNRLDCQARCDEDHPHLQQSSHPERLDCRSETKSRCPLCPGGSFGSRKGAGQVRCLDSSNQQRDARALSRLAEGCVAGCQRKLPADCQFQIRGIIHRQAVFSG